MHQLPGKLLAGDRLAPDAAENGLGTQSAQHSRVGSQAGHAHRAQTAVVTVVKADNGKVPGNLYPLIQKNFQQPGGDFVVVAHHGGAGVPEVSCKKFQPGGISLLNQRQPLIGIIPENRFLPGKQIPLPQSLHHAGVAQGALPVVQLENTADPGVTLFQQMPGGQISACLVIVPQHRQAQLRIAAVNEDNGHSGGPELLIQIQIGIGQSGFGALNDETLHRMLQQLGQDLPFFFKLIVRAVDQGGEAVFQQSLLTFHQQGREDIGVGKADDDGNGVIAGRDRLLLLQDYGSAALAAGNEPLPGQDFQRAADGLTANVIDFHQLLLGRQPICGAVIPSGDGGAQRRGQLGVFCGHFSTFSMRVNHTIA